MSEPFNANIRQRQCTMEVTAAISNDYDKDLKGGHAGAGNSAVTIDSDGKVDIGAAGEELFGQLQSLDSDGVASITDEGYVDSRSKMAKQSLTAPELFAEQPEQSKPEHRQRLGRSVQPERVKFELSSGNSRASKGFPNQGIFQKFLIIGELIVMMDFKKTPAKD